MNPSPSPATFTSAHGRALILKILLVVGAVVTGMSLVTEALSLRFPVPTETEELSDNVIGAVLALIMFLVAVLEFIIYITTVVFFCMWLHRAYKNLRAFSTWSRLDSSPGWAVGSFFVPFINLVVPYRAVKEVWEKSWPSDEGLLSAPAAPATFPLWWTFWLLSVFAGNLSTRLYFRGDVPESTQTMVSILASFLSIVAAVFAYLVVDAIDKRQEETIGRVNIVRPAGPPPPLSNLPMPVAAPNNSQ